MKRKIVTIFLIFTSFFITGCTEAAQPGSSAGTETDPLPSHIDTGGYTGPSLADYVNEGIDEAKENGHYTNTDYSSVRYEGDTTVPGENTSDNDTGQNLSDNVTDQNPSGDKTDSYDYSHAVSDDVLTQLASLEYDGEPYIYVNDNTPYFTDEELTFTDTFESYSDLDDLGRTGYAFASINESLMPANREKREDISSVKPTGWKQKKYDSVDGGWLYNRCHLIAWSLAAENDNERNLMTGTRYFNVEGMLPFEMQALEYLDKNSKNHVLYRSTPVYEDNDLLAKGLLLEAYSIEDNGELFFCAYLFNVQPGITIDYETGESQIME